MRFLPGSLKGQLIALTLVATILSQLASLLFVLDDHRSRIKNVWFHNVLARIATAKEVIDTTPAGLHGKILKSVDSWAVHYAIDAQPLVGAGVNVSAAFQDQIGKTFRNDHGKVMLAFDSSLNDEPLIELLLGDLWRDIKHTFTSEGQRGRQAAVSTPYAHVSVPLENGGWLNVVALQRGLATPVWPIAVQFATMAAISAAGIILVLGRLTRPLKELAKAASAPGPRGDKRNTGRERAGRGRRDDPRLQRDAGAAHHLRPRPRENAGGAWARSQDADHESTASRRIHRGRGCQGANPADARRNGANGRSHAVFRTRGSGSGTGAARGHGRAHVKRVRGLGRYGA